MILGRRKDQHAAVKRLEANAVFCLSDAVDMGEDRKAPLKGTARVLNGGKRMELDPSIVKEASRRQGEKPQVGYWGQERARCQEANRLSKSIWPR